jgi:hypothetical protein
MVDKEDEDGSLYGDDPIEAVPEPLFKINKFRWPTLQRHNTENSKQIFPEKELRGHRSNSDMFL